MLNVNNFRVKTRISFIELCNFKINISIPLWAV